MNDEFRFDEIKKSIIKAVIALTIALIIGNVYYGRYKKSNEYFDQLNKIDGFTMQDQIEINSDTKHLFCEIDEYAHGIINECKNYKFVNNYSNKTLSLKSDDNVEIYSKDNKLLTKGIYVGYYYSTMYKYDKKYYAPYHIICIESKYGRMKVFKIDCSKVILKK